MASSRVYSVQRCFVLITALFSIRREYIAVHHNNSKYNVTKYSSTSKNNDISSLQTLQEV